MDFHGALKKIKAATGRVRRLLWGAEVPRHETVPGVDRRRVQQGHRVPCRSLMPWDETLHTRSGW